MDDRRRNLSSLIPNAEELLALDPPELAFSLMACLLTMREEELNLYNLNLRDEFTRGYPPGSKKDIAATVSGAWSWLLGQGYLGQRPGANDSSWVAVTPQGKRWYDTQIARRSSASLETGPSDALSNATSLESAPLGPCLITPVFAYGVPATFFAKPGTIRLKILPNSDDGFILFDLSNSKVTEDTTQLVVPFEPTPLLGPTSLSFKVDSGKSYTFFAAFQGNAGASIFEDCEEAHLLDRLEAMEATAGKRYHIAVSQHPPLPDLDPSAVSPKLGAPDTTPRSREEGGKGPSTHVARDKWTVDDSLGYFPYAYAIFRFLTDSETAPPLAISIQAPWGGGKTSLMRMIQAQLDPDNPGLAAQGGDASTDSRSHATVRQLNEVLAGKHRGPGSGELNVGNAKNRVTVWFNAWKYESTNQIWAGLADAIVKQVVERLTPDERELFFFRLHLKRLDVEKLRKQITYGLLSRVFNVVVRWWWLYLVIPTITYAAHHLITYAAHHFMAADMHWEFLADWGFLGIGLDFVLLVAHSLLAKKSLDEMPARLVFGDLVTAPDYDANLGFIHQVTEDLKLTLNLVAPASRPLVVFIDDLDRCSPNKVSDVVEAINLFLAGEFEHCMFVLGIDDEIVAAALNKSHSDVFALMPSYARGTSIGWRFMDKFVQLPFIMPPPSANEMKDYAKSLLVTKVRNGRLSLAARQKVASSVEGRQSTDKTLDAIVQEVKRELNLDKTEEAELRREAETIEKMDSDIKVFSDEEEGIANTIMAGIGRYSRNPRDAKRFVNSFRFYYFLRSARLTRHADVPSIDQLSRWILISLRWPAIIRWLRSTGPLSDDQAINGLVRMEQLATNSTDATSWSKTAALLMGLSEKEGAWLADQDLFAFFVDEAHLAVTERLSSSLGKGLW
jgi:KAP family P-loop domain